MKYSETLLKENPFPYMLCIASAVRNVGGGRH